MYNMSMARLPLILINVINANSSNTFPFVIIKQIAKNCLVCIDKSFIFFKKNYII